MGQTTANYKLDVNGAIKTNTCLLVGTSTDTNRLISALDGITTAGSFRYISLGTSNSTGNQAEFRFCYQGSISTSNYLGIGFYANSDILTITHNKKVGIGNNNPSYPLTVSLTTTTTYSGYGYINSSGVTGYTSGSSGSVAVAAYFGGRILVGGEVDIQSDIRKKKNVKDLRLDMCKRFVDEIQPKKFQYNWIQDDQQSYGYIAQDIAKKGFHDLVNLLPDEGLEEKIDDDNFVSPKDSSFVISTQNFIPILHMTIKDLYAQIEELKKLINVSKDEIEVPIEDGEVSQNEVESASVDSVESFETVNINGRILRLRKI
jgi:hypothetical protein